MVIDDVEISNNNGAEVVNEGFLGLTGSHVTNNTNPTFNGGGIFQPGTDNTILEFDTIVDHNTAAGTGGGIYLENGTVSVPLQTQVHDNSPNNCASQDPNKPIQNCINEAQRETKSRGASA
jgi:predicted outer membrane repeat protein